MRSGTGFPGYGVGWKQRLVQPYLRAPSSARVLAAAMTLSARLGALRREHAHRKGRKQGEHARNCEAGRASGKASSACGLGTPSTMGGTLSRVEVDHSPRDAHPMRRFSIAAFVAGLAALATCRTSGPAPIRLGTTYTVAQSGVLAVLESLWTGPGITAVVAPSGQVLRTAASGDLDVVITHAPVLEERLLVALGHASLQCPFVASRFAVVGPVGDPARVRDAHTAADAFRRIARARGPFVSRADSSGTHVKELALWRAAGVMPEPRWRLESGTDQAATLHLADERNAYALADLPTFGALKGLGLRVLFVQDTALLNPYTLYVVRHPAPPPAARAFALWAERAGRDAILKRRLPDSTPAFVARSGDCSAPEERSTSATSKP